MGEDARRQALSAFLKSCRARLAPAEAGLPETRRRRTPGLRREEIAALSGVSLTWYTHLEQGRDVRASVDVLERLAAALRLNSVEREYLFELGQNRPAPLPRGGVDDVTPAMRRMLNALPVPAYITTMRWDVVAWNPMCAAVLRDYGAMPEKRRNLIRILFSQSGYPDDPEEYHAMARRLVAKLRIDYSQFPGDPGMERLVTDMCRDSALFRELWATPEVEDRSEGISVAPHETGPVQLEHTSYVPEGSPTLRVVIFTPLDEEAAGRLAQIQAGLKTG